MSEELLQAIIRLLAIVAVEGEVTSDERNTILKFLEENLSKEDVTQYLRLFDRLTEKLEATNISSERDKRQILKITEKFNQEFTSQQKIVVMMVLMELILADGKVTDREKELLYFTAESFNIPSEEVEEMQDFLMNGERELLLSDNVLLVDNGLHDIEAHDHHVVHEQLDGYLVILRLQSVGMYFIKYMALH